MVDQGLVHTYKGIFILLFEKKSCPCENAKSLHLHLADAFIQSDLQCIQAIHFFVSMCVPWELNPQPFALLTQCSTTEPQENNFSYKNVSSLCGKNAYK